MIKLYGFEPSTPVNRVRLCLNALELEYKFIRINPIAGEGQADDYLKLSPAGKIPAIDDDGFALFESNTIMKYLCRKYKSDFYPSDITSQANVDKWLDFTAIHLSPGFGNVLFNKVVTEFTGSEVNEQSLNEGYAQIERFLSIIDKQLSTSTFFASNAMTIADFSLLATVDGVDVLEIDMSKYPSVEAWRQKLMQEAFYTKMHSSYSEALDTFKKEIAK